VAREASGTHSRHRKLVPPAIEHRTVAEAKTETFAEGIEISHHARLSALATLWRRPRGGKADIASELRPAVKRVITSATPATSECIEVVAVKRIVPS
jgi:hypothetical protein